ncbi:MAG: hypothetical protein Q9212_003216 [Teloschistes hypoglaucus]
MLYHSKIALFNTSILAWHFLAIATDKAVIQSPIIAWYTMYSSSMKGKDATKRYLSDQWTSTRDSISEKGVSLKRATVAKLEGYPVVKAVWDIMINFLWLVLYISRKIVRPSAVFVWSIISPMIYRPIRKIIASRIFRRTLITITSIAVLLGLAYWFYPEATVATIDTIRKSPGTVRETLQEWRCKISDIYTAGMARICQPYFATAEKASSLYTRTVYQISSAYTWTVYQLCRPVVFTRDLIVGTNLLVCWAWICYSLSAREMGGKKSGAKREKVE